MLPTVNRPTSSDDKGKEKEDEGRKRGTAARKGTESGLPTTGGSRLPTIKRDTPLVAGGGSFTSGTKSPFPPSGTTVLSPFPSGAGRPTSTTTVLSPSPSGAGRPTSTTTVLSPSPFVQSPFIRSVSSRPSPVQEPQLPTEEPVNLGDNYPVAPRSNEKIEESNRNYRNYVEGVEKIKYSVINYIITEEVEPQRKTVTKAVETTLSLWIQAFTDDSRSTLNLEGLENFGDGILGAVMLEHIHRKYPTISPDDATNMINYYATNNFNRIVLNSITREIPSEKDKRTDVYVTKEGTLTDLMFYDQDLVKGTTLKETMAADLYESILGALYRCGDSVYVGKGWIWCMAFFEKFNKNRVVYNRELRSDPYGNLKQAFERFSFRQGETGGGGGVDIDIGKPVVTERAVQFGGLTFSENTSTVTVKISLRGAYESLTRDFFLKRMTPKGRAALRGIDRHYIIGEATEPTEKLAKYSASDKALNYMRENLGVTIDWMDKAKEDYDGIDIDKTKIRYRTILDNKGNEVSIQISDERGASELGMYSLFLLKLKYEGYVSHSIDKPTKKLVASNRTVLYLNGVLENGRINRLANFVGGGNTFETKKILYFTYLSQA